MPAAFARARPTAGRKTEHYKPRDAARRLARRVQVGTERKRARRDGAAMSASPVRTSSPAAARVHSAAEVARLAFNKGPLPDKGHLSPILQQPAMQVAAVDKRRDVARALHILVRRERRPAAATYTCGDLVR